MSTNKVAMQSLEVPAYVAEQFIAKRTRQSNHHPQCQQRVYKLINQTLEDYRGFGWEVNSRQYHSKYDSDLYGLECVEGTFFIYGKERGRKDAHAVFENLHSAAEYFVWIVSDGNRKIDWGLYLDMEPDING